MAKNVGNNPCNLYSLLFVWLCEVVSNALTYDRNEERVRRQAISHYVWNNDKAFVTIGLWLLVEKAETGQQAIEYDVGDLHTEIVHLLYAMILCCFA